MANTPRSNPWNGRANEEFDTNTQKQRTFRVNLPTCYMAKDVLEAVSKNLGHEQIDTVAKPSQQGYWMIITKSIQDANTLLDLEDLYMAEGEGYRLIPRVKRATLLTIPYADLEIRNSDLMKYFRMYGDVKKVRYEYHRDAKFSNVKTGRRLVFIELFPGCGAPPFCVVKGQKMTVSYRGRRALCHHCNVEGHSKANCPVAKFKTCYNCGSPDHEQAQCWEPTFVAYFFEEDRDYPPQCYPTNYKSNDPDDDTEYGLIQHIDEVRDYHMTFNPYFYTPDAAERYKEDTYGETDHEDDSNGDNNIKGI